ncbi:FAD dependent oxidoreductase [Anatilimnocola aggregata]|uniref:FAD dependent oxidoreductase n=1 Tax=Anatilimnocola aggregata TaxID=2528021 RepID=A0A517Y782_9BACT|nr:FAD-dependent oxidoreductase [Anatilimnocola aggregata]QDU26091.1 FAD dependent oxidoreductase [Anatilimnocola aggregata]
MQRRDFLQTTLATGSLALAAVQSAAGNDKGAQSSACDVFVYGSTPGGIAAAIEAARRGLRVTLACPYLHPGGMAASGLCTTDAVRRHLFGGLVLEFVRRVREEYVSMLGEQHPDFKLIHDGWYYEPSVAQRVFNQMIALQAPRLRYLPAHHLEAAQCEGAKIVSVRLEGERATQLIRAQTFIDGTYEGDLAAAAKVPYRVGREAQDEFNEPLAGIHYMNFRTGKQIVTADSGQASPAIQAFCARSIFTDDPAQRVPIEKPATYEEHLPDFEPLLGDFKSGRVTRWSSGAKLPGRKIEANGHIEWLTSLNCPGKNWTWPEAAREPRAQLAKFHIDHAAGMLWFLQNDKRVPENIRSQVASLGLHKQEFVTSGHWPWQIYVRQGRRIEGRAKITQLNFMPDKDGRTPRVEHPIALGEHSFDVHPCQDRSKAVDGFMEGVLWYPSKATGPARPGQIPYGALLPKNIDNLLVPVAMSCTHVAMSVLRMEPVWMTTGQIAGYAAFRAHEQSMDVAAIDPAKLASDLKIATAPT